MEQADKDYLVEEIRDHIEDKLEGVMLNSVQIPLERTLIEHLTAINRIEVDSERNHNMRWKWILALLALSMLTNAGLTVMVYLLIKTQV